MDLSKEEIENKLEGTENPEELIDLLNYYASNKTQKELEYSKTLAERAFELSKEQGYTKGEAQSLLNKSIQLFYNSDFDAMLECALRSEEIMRKLPENEQKEPLGLHRVINCKGICYFYQGDYITAADFFEETIILCRAAGDLGRLGSIYNNLSTIYDRMENPRKALEYSLKALEQLRRNENDEGLVYALNNAGNYSCDIGAYSESLSYLEEARVLVKKQGYTHDEPMVLVSLSHVYQAMKEYKKAEELLKRCLTLSRSLSIPREEITSLAFLGTISREVGETAQAITYFYEALECIDTYQIHYFEKNIHKNLEEIYIEQDNYKKAYFHQGAFYNLEKKNRDTELAGKMRSLEVDFLRNANQGIKVISSLGQKITSTLDTRTVMDYIYSSFNTLIDAPLFGIITYNSEKNHLDYELYIEDGKYLDPYFIRPDNPASLTALAFRDKRDIVIGDFKREFQNYLPRAGSFEECLIDTGNRAYPHSVLFSPLIVGGQVIGIISAASYKKNAYTISDLDSVKALGSYVAIALQNSGQAELIRRQNLRLSQANEKLHKDILLSRQLQLAMIPSRFPESSMYSIFGYVDFQDAVGGDLYDVYRISPDKTVVLILDVVGHGASAALVTAMAKILFFNKSKDHLSASAIVEAVNRELTPITGESFSYFSLFFGIINSRDRTLEYVNAGHPEPFLIKEDRSARLLGSSSLFVGIKEDFTYEQKKIDLEKNDRLVLFTDGFFETKGKNKKRFGEDRLLQTMISTKELAPREVLIRLNRELKAYQCYDEAVEDDDKTMLIIDFQ